MRPEGKGLSGGREKRRARCLVCGRELEVNMWGYFCCGGRGEDGCWFTWLQEKGRVGLQWYDHGSDAVSRWNAVPWGCLLVADRGMA